MSEVRVRIAPSPTGYLHIGTARTALFNYLFARQTGGKFLLRIEDTDFARNSEASYNSILQGLDFLGLNPDEEVLYQSKRMAQHVLEAEKLIANGSAYYCFLPQEEIEKRRLKKGYIHKYTKGDEAPREGINPVIRIKVPRNTDIINDDLIKGRVVISSEAIEDFVIVRADKTPIYMLSVVCDDIYMKISHVLRGDDHLTNTPKQILIYNGLGVKPPLFGHIPLIHGADGAKLSKRHGALGIEEYKNMGYLPEALRSYLINLGWGEGETKILTDSEMVKAFDIGKISHSPARFDFEKLNNTNHHFISLLSADYIMESLLKISSFKAMERIKRAVEKIRYRFKTLAEMAESFKAFEDSYAITEEANKLLTENKNTLHEVYEFLKSYKASADLEASFKDFLKLKGISFGKVGPALRAALIGTTSSIGIFEIIYILGEEETLNRLTKCL